MDIDDIKKKILEDVDPETKRKRAHERRVQRFVWEMLSRLNARMAKNM